MYAVLGLGWRRCATVAASAAAFGWQPPIPEELLRVAVLLCVVDNRDVSLSSVSQIADWPPPVQGVDERGPIETAPRKATTEF